ncbi:hypothetical protein [Edaphobacillus lindanitolerans]|uniref:DUF4870 domain-containing protein n=1 Tax=Edaphobacillus lindanitolerans TaxID=550447 RepID=A0A1U7PNQ5_9BACI|nr:hypothetical protein [Edaphobacillus lindanitolerans]SIT93106.1 hypothetical protein SAMN05428946_2948 [Edaphobacillus lindanitolerans]
MDTSRLLSSLNYFSIAFAPFLFPAIVFFTSGEPSVRRHAKRACLIQLIPAVPFAALLIVTVMAANAFRQAPFTGGVPAVGHAGVQLLLALLFAGAQGLAFLWCVAAGVRALRS